MIIEGKVNLVTCDTTTMVELKEALDIALKQRIMLLKKKSRRDSTFARFGMTDLEKQLVGISEEKNKLPIYTVENDELHTMSHILD